METELMMKDVMASLKETDRILRERGEETDRILRERSEETDRKMAETDRIVKEMSRKVSEVSRQLGQLGNRLGEFVEWIVKPGLVRVFQERGIDVHETLHNAVSSRGGEGTQVDFLVVNDTEVVAVEVKTNLSIEGIDFHLLRLAKFRRLFPRYADCTLYGAIAAVVRPEDATAYAFSKGLFVIGQAGEDAIIINPSDFRPTAF